MNWNEIGMQGAFLIIRIRARGARAKRASAQRPRRDPNSSGFLPSGGLGVPAGRSALSAHRREQIKVNWQTSSVLHALAFLQFTSICSRAGGGG